MPGNRKKRLLRRDYNICGQHIDGCGKRITKSERTGSTIDHIIPRDYFMKVAPERKDEFQKDWNLQSMHHDCNVVRGGQLDGYPAFRCGCHFLHIKEGDLYICAWDYARGEWSLHMIVSEIAVETSPIRQAASKRGHRLVTREYIVIAGGWRGPRGRHEIGFGRGESGHIIARMSPDDAKKFNMRELIRSYHMATTPEMAKMARGIMMQLAKGKND